MPLTQLQRSKSYPEISKPLTSEKLTKSSSESNIKDEATFIPRKTLTSRDKPISLRDRTETISITSSTSTLSISSGLTAKTDEALSVSSGADSVRQKTKPPTIGRQQSVRLQKLREAGLVDTTRRAEMIKKTHDFFDDQEKRKKSKEGSPKQKALEVVLKKAEEITNRSWDDMDVVTTWLSDYKETQQESINIESISDALKRQIVPVLRHAGFTIFEHQLTESEWQHSNLLRSCWHEAELTLNVSNKGITRLSTSWINNTCHENLLKIDCSFNQLTHIETLEINPVILDLSYNMLTATPDIITYQYASNLQFAFLDSNKIITCRFMEKQKIKPRNRLINFDNITTYFAPVPVSIDRLYTAKNLCLLSLSHNPTLQSFRIANNFAGVINLMHSLPAGSQGAKILQRYAHHDGQANDKSWPTLPQPSTQRCQRIIRIHDKNAKHTDPSLPEKNALFKTRSELIKLATEMKHAGKACLIVTAQECYYASCMWSALYPWYVRADSPLPEEGPLALDNNWQRVCGDDQETIDTIRNYFHQLANHEIKQKDSKSDRKTRILAEHVCSIIDQLNNDLTLLHECYPLIKDFSDMREYPDSMGDYFARCLVALQIIQRTITMVQATRCSDFRTLLEQIRGHMILKLLQQHLIEGYLPEDLIEKYGKVKVINELTIMYQNLLQADDELSFPAILGDDDTDDQGKRKPGTLPGTIQEEYQIPDVTIAEIKRLIKEDLADPYLLQMELRSNRFWVAGIMHAFNDDIRKIEHAYTKIARMPESSDEEADDESDLGIAFSQLFDEEKELNEIEEKKKQRAVSHKIEELTSMLVHNYYETDIGEEEYEYEYEYKVSEWLNIEEHTLRKTLNDVEKSPFI